jgi:YHS domain-containing protein
VDPYAGQDYRKPAADDRYADYYGNRQPPGAYADPVNPPYAAQWTPGSGAAGPQQPPSNPPPVSRATFALEGHCPVHLLEQSAWVAGDERWGANHRDKTYLFVSQSCQQKFMADPDRYAPVLSGNDPVALVDRGESVPGRREHGCYFGVEPNRRVVLFANEASYQTFSRNPQRYAGQIYAPPQ